MGQQNLGRGDQQYRLLLCNLLSTVITGNNQDFSWYLTGVYALNDIMEREEAWWEIASVRVSDFRSMGCL